MDTSDENINMKMDHRAELDISQNRLTSDYIPFLHILTWQSVFDGDSDFVLHYPYRDREDAFNKVVEHGVCQKEAYSKKDLDELGEVDTRIGKTGLFKDIVVIKKERVYMRLFRRFQTTSFALISMV